MTPEHQTLVGWLRLAQSSRLCEDAAAAIEALSAEVERVKIATVVEHFDRNVARAEKAEAERDLYLSRCASLVCFLPPGTLAGEVQEWGNKYSIRLKAAEAENARLTMLADRLKAEIESLVGKFKADTVALEADNDRLRALIARAMKGGLNGSEYYDAIEATQTGKEMADALRETAPKEATP